MITTGDLKAHRATLALDLQQVLADRKQVIPRAAIDAALPEIVTAAGGVLRSRMRSAIPKPVVLMADGTELEAFIRVGLKPDVLSDAQAMVNLNAGVNPAPKKGGAN